MTYLSRTSCNAGVTKDHAEYYVSPSLFSCVSVLVGAHAGFLLTQSFFLLFEKKIEFSITPFLKFSSFSNFGTFLKCQSRMPNSVVSNALEMRAFLSFFPETLSFLPFPPYHLTNTQNK